MSIYSKEPSEQHSDFSDIFHSAIEKVFDGNLGVWCATMLPLACLTILTTIILSTAVYSSSLTDFAVSAVLMILIWLLLAHLFFTCLRIFAFGETYATYWSAVSESYTDDHRGRLRRAFGVFVLYSLALGLPAFVFYRFFDGIEELLFEQFDSVILIVVLYAPIALILHVVNFVILAVFSQVWMNRAIDSPSNGFWQNIIDSVKTFSATQQTDIVRKYALSFAILLWIPDLILFALVASNVVYNIAEIGFLGILIISVTAVFFRVWSILLYAGFASSAYELLFLMPTKSEMNDVILADEELLTRNNPARGGSFVSLADNEAEEKAKQLKAMAKKEKKKKKSAKNDSLFY